MERLNWESGLGVMDELVSPYGEDAYGRGFWELCSLVPLISSWINACPSVRAPSGEIRGSASEKGRKKNRWLEKDV